MRRWFNAWAGIEQPAYRQPDAVTDGSAPTVFRLPSREGLNFHVSAVVNFQVKSAMTRPDPMSIAMVSIQHRAETTGTDISLMDWSRLEVDLEVALGTPKITDNPQVAAYAQEVSVSVDEGELNAVVEYERSRALAILGDWEWERRQVRSGQIVELLSDPSRATAWWLASATPNDLNDAKRVAESFVEIARILHLDGKPQSGPVAVIAQLWDELDLVQRDGALRLLGQYADQVDRDDLSEALKRLRA